MNKEQFSQGQDDDLSDGRHFSRRDFLKISGSGLFVFYTAGSLGMVSMQQRGRTYPTDFNAYLKIGDNERVSVFCSKIEMGQGIITSMAQMLAEELDVALDSIDMIMGDTMLCPWDSGTTGSRSTKFYGPPLRRAGAEARAVLLQMASEKLNITTEHLVVKNGTVSDKSNPSLKITYAELVKGKQIERLISEVPIKSVAEHSVSGKPMLRMDALQKVTGDAKFTGDLQLPGMLYAKVLRPPSHDARLVSADVSKARDIDGSVVIHEDDLIAVLHKKPEMAEKALATIVAKWDTTAPKTDNQSIFDTLKNAAPDGRVYIEDGNLTEGEAAAKQNIETEFYNHYVAHSPMEPYTVLAHAEGDKATVWASTQAPFRVRETAANALNIPEENVRVITPFVGGGFGGKKSGRQISEAVKLSKITGHPVQLAWTRKEEFFFDAFRPAAVVQLKAGLNAKGLTTFWDCDVLFGGARSSEPIYDIPHYSVKMHSRGSVHPFDTGAWRGPGSNTNVFAMESFTDMLAQAAGTDPLSFRLNNLTDERMIRVIEAAGDKFGHDFKKSPSGEGYGISCTNYLNSYVATIAQVTVDKTTGEVKVERVVCAQDMGEIINPQGARLQIESGITMGISAALSEEVEFSGGTIFTENFDSYRITRFSDVPVMDIVLIDNPELAPQGCGEPAITTMGAALANAVFDAVGARVLTLPMTPGRILAAIKK
ncbi:molybdopterin-dependent oxidoreductase [Maribellus comscasis]|uniref:Molybdopterin-dependent oxidoreductase n=1 Tax=Maribellus comscasis TaxID=2681766 RepID=A0A6I6JQ78_9BACT|nr:molybdopterin cofactor-binding domain-containing protein [Maribellus comscasis]QGY43208.1 molybdopterin-dependent oxidoreductase [Maribellus comscasis]